MDRGSGGAAAAEAEPELVNGIKFSHQILEGFDAKGLKALVDENKKKLGSGASTVISINEGRATIVVGVTEDLTGRLNAADLVKAGVVALGGAGGGGRADMAQGGGPDGAAAGKAIEAVRAAIGG